MDFPYEQNPFDPRPAASTDKPAVQPAKAAEFAPPAIGRGDAAERPVKRTEKPIDIRIPEEVAAKQVQPVNVTGRPPLSRASATVSLPPTAEEMSSGQPVNPFRSAPSLPRDKTAPFEGFGFAEPSSVTVPRARAVSSKQDKADYTAPANPRPSPAPSLTPSPAEELLSPDRDQKADLKGFSRSREPVPEIATEMALPGGPIKPVSGAGALRDFPDVNPMTGMPAVPVPVQPKSREAAYFPGAAPGFSTPTPPPPSGTVPSEAITSAGTQGTTSRLTGSISSQPIQTPRSSAAAEANNVNKNAAIFGQPTIMEKPPHLRSAREAAASVRSGDSMIVKAQRAVVRDPSYMTPDSAAAGTRVPPVIGYESPLGPKRADVQSAFSSPSLRRTNPLADKSPPELTVNPKDQHLLYANPLGREELPKPAAFQRGGPLRDPESGTKVSSGSANPGRQLHGTLKLVSGTGRELAKLQLENVEER